jgi:hypothetical protein
VITVGARLRLERAGLEPAELKAPFSDSAHAWMSSEGTGG